MKPASFAVALNCGIGSSSLNAEVNAFDRLQIVLALNSSYCGLFPPIWKKGAVNSENTAEFSIISSPLPVKKLHRQSDAVRRFRHRSDFDGRRDVEVLFDGLLEEVAHRRRVHFVWRDEEVISFLVLGLFWQNDAAGIFLVNLGDHGFQTEAALNPPMVRSGL
jgi:hypothetical protein